jgi:DNA repair photolyase
MKCVKGYIERKTMLYKTGVEYGDFTMNHVLGCSHGCQYPCYAYLMARRFGKVSSYNEWTEPYLVSNTIDILENEIPKLKSRIKSVQLCFTTDPFMYEYDEIQEMSIESIKKLNASGIKCTVLTKGILPENLADLSKNNEYGITLVSLNEQYRIHTEPGAAPYQERLQSLKRLHYQGCKTWVSIEPYPTPNIMNQDINTILNELTFTNRIVFGRTNYSKLVSSYENHKQFYNTQAKHVVEFCRTHGIEYYIKKGTVI